MILKPFYSFRIPGAKPCLQLGGLDGVRLYDSIIGGDGEEVCKLAAGRELVEQANCLEEVAPAPTLLSQLSAQQLFRGCQGFGTQLSVSWNG